MKMIINDCYGGFGIRMDILEKLKLTAYSEGDDVIRSNPQLIKMIEAGEDISDSYAKLKVVEIPDESTDWYLDEYDGLESVIYVVDGKLNWA